jgi:hypothetical protein
MRCVCCFLVCVCLVLSGCGSDSGAAEAYEAFAQALATNDYDAAVELTASTSPAKARVMMDRARSESLPDAATVTASSFQVESEQVRRTVNLRLRQTATLVKEGQSSVEVVYLHDVVMQETDDGWQVISFDRELVE